MFRKKRPFVSQMAYYLKAFCSQTYMFPLLVLTICVFCGLLFVLAVVAYYLCFLWVTLCVICCGLPSVFFVTYYLCWLLWLTDLVLCHVAKCVIHISQFWFVITGISHICQCVCICVCACVCACVRAKLENNVVGVYENSSGIVRTRSWS